MRSWPSSAARTSESSSSRCEQSDVAAAAVSMELRPVAATSEQGDNPHPGAEVGAVEALVKKRVLGRHLGLQL